MMPMLCEKEIKALFKRHGLRCTRQRIAVYETLSQSAHHPTADDLFCQVSQHHDGMSLATIYNSLEALCQAGLIQKIPGTCSHGHGNGSARYDATVDNHLHARDPNTGRVCDVPQDLSKDLLNQLPRETLNQIESKLGFKIKHVQIELVGAYQET